MIARLIRPAAVVAVHMMTMGNGFPLAPSKRNTFNAVRHGEGRLAIDAFPRSNKQTMGSNTASHNDAASSLPTSWSDKAEGDLATTSTLPDESIPSNGTAAIAGKQKDCIHPSRRTVKTISGGLVATTVLTSFVVGKLARGEMGPLSPLITAVPYAACLAWGIPLSMIGSWKSILSLGHRFCGIGTLVLPLLLATYHAATGLFPNLILYFGTVLLATLNLTLGGMLITRRVPGYDIPTLRAFAVGVSLGFAFLGHSLFFTLGQYRWYKPIAFLFGGISIYSAIFAWNDALQHTWNYCKGNRGTLDLFHESGLNGGKTNPPRRRKRRFWTLPFEKAKLQDVFFRNLWKQPTYDALRTTVSPANGVVLFTTGMTALFATLSLLQLRFLSIGTMGMQSFVSQYPYFAQWSALQALLAVVANNFGTFAGTLVIQRQTTQKQAGIYNAIGLLIPVVNIITYLAVLQQPPIPIGPRVDNFLWLIKIPSITQ